jgi:hypothetical protein
MRQVHDINLKAKLFLKRTCKTGRYGHWLGTSLRTLAFDFLSASF